MIPSLLRISGKKYLCYILFEMISMPSLLQISGNNDERTSRYHHYFGYPDTMMCATCRSKCFSMPSFFRMSRSMMSATKDTIITSDIRIQWPVLHPVRNDSRSHHFFGCPLTMMSATQDTIITSDIRKQWSVLHAVRNVLDAIIASDIRKQWWAQLRIPSLFRISRNNDLC